MIKNVNMPIWSTKRGEIVPFNTPQSIMHTRAALLLHLSGCETAIGMPSGHIAQNVLRMNYSTSQPTAIGNSLLPSPSSPPPSTRISNATHFSFLPVPYL